jgi:hypothetical protein
MMDGDMLRREFDITIRDSISETRSRLAEIHRAVDDIAVRVARLEERALMAEPLIVQKAVETAVVAVLTRLSINPNDTNELAQFRTNLSTGIAVRDMAQKGMWAAVAGVCSLAVALIWTYVVKNSG